MRFGTRGASARWRKRRESGSRGAVLVEFALVAPLLFLLIFGIIEFGWAFFQLLDVRHGARETARLVAVNYKATNSSGDPQTVEIITEGCARMDSGDDVTIQITGGGIVSSGATATIEVEKPLDTLTGFFDVVLGGVDLSSNVDIRVEQNSTWNPTTAPGAC